MYLRNIFENLDPQKKKNFPCIIIVTLFKNWPQPICPSVSDKLGYNGTFFKDKKKMRYQATKRHGQILKAYC